MLKHLTCTQKLKLRTVVHITFFWAIVASIFTVHNHLFLLSTLQVGFENYNFVVNLLVTILIIPLAGFLGGGTIVYFFKENIRKFPLWIALIVDSVIIVVVIIVVSIPASLIYNSIYFNKPPWDMMILVHALDFMFGYGLAYTFSGALFQPQR